MATNEGLLRALRDRRFLVLWLGQTISAFGDGLHNLALVWWVMATVKSGAALGTVLICQTVPLIAFLMIGGVIVDRFDRTRIMLYSDIARFGLTAVFAYLMYTDKLELWHVYVFAVLFGSVASFFRPAYSALIPLIVPTEDLPSANSLGALSSQLSTVLGPVLGAVIIAVGHSALAFAIDAATFAISALCILPLLGKVKKPTVEGDVPAASMLADLRAGITFVKSEPWLWLSILAFLAINFTYGAGLTVVLPVLITRNLAGDASALGAVNALVAGGTALAAMWLGRRAPSKRRGLVIYGWVLAQGLAMAAMALPLSIYGIAALACLLGCSTSAIVLVWTNLMQERVPEDMLGRAFSVDMMSAYLPMPIGMAVMGWATDHYSVSHIIGICGVVQVVAGGLALLHPALRRIQ